MNMKNMNGIVRIERTAIGALDWVGGCTGASDERGPWVGSRHAPIGFGWMKRWRREK